VLPGGVDKGRALLAVLEHFRIAPECVLACGDTLNDLSLFRTGLCAVAVGGSEPALLTATRGAAKVLHARARGAGGITEAILHFFGPGRAGSGLASHDTLQAFDGDIRP